MKLEVNRVLLPLVHHPWNVHAWLVTLQNILHVHRESAQLVHLIYYSSTIYNFSKPSALGLLFKYRIIWARSVICRNMLFINQLHIAVFYQDYRSIPKGLLITCTCLVLYSQRSGQFVVSIRVVKQYVSEDLVGSFICVGCPSPLL